MMNLTQIIFPAIPAVSGLPAIPALATHQPAARPNGLGDQNTAAMVEYAFVPL